MVQSMATISDIAARAGVSSALVSRVLNRKPGVSPGNRARILAVMEELNYRPNTLARSLVLQRTQTIGVVMDTLCASLFYNLIYGLQETGEALGYNVVFCSGRSDAQVKAHYIDYFGSGRADGLIVYGSHLNDRSLLEALVQRNANFVLIEGTLPGKAVNSIRVDNVRGAYLATEQLIRSGCRRIAHFTGDMNYQVSQDRLEGFRKAIEEHSAPVDGASVIEAVFSEQSGYEAMAALLRGGSAPDGAFFGSDRIAYGALQAMAERGLRAPDDIAVIGFDDDPPAGWAACRPKLSTVRQPMYEMGAEGIRLLVETIENPEREKVVKLFEPELVLRETCGKTAGIG